MRFVLSHNIHIIDCVFVQEEADKDGMKFELNHMTWFFSQVDWKHISIVMENFSDVPIGKSHATRPQS